ncbi:hypothetical protein R6Z07F_013997 [Ovis aries]
MFARLLPAQGDTPSFRRLDEIAHGLAPGHDVSSGCLADSEVAALRPLRLCRVVAAGLSGSGWCKSNCGFCIVEVYHLILEYILKYGLYFYAVALKFQKGRKPFRELCSSRYTPESPWRLDEEMLSEECKCRLSQLL